jgi:hypothetical protein
MAEFALSSRSIETLRGARNAVVIKCSHGYAVAMIDHKKRTRTLHSEQCAELMEAVSSVSSEGRA